MSGDSNLAAPLLVTGFEPFDGAAANPSGDAARMLDGELIAGRRVVGLQLPCVFGLAPARLLDAVKLHGPALVLCLGLAPSRRGFHPERVAINLDDARIADNLGVQPLDRPAIEGAPAAYFATLPVKVMVGALQDPAWGAELSHSAGTYVCNHVFFHLMHGLADTGEIRGGFMHVGADLSAAQVAEGVRRALAAALAAEPVGAAANSRVGGSID